VTIPADPLDLSGRVALITGAARGIGAATAALLGRHGAVLALCDRLPSDTFPGAPGDDNPLAPSDVAALLDVRDHPGVDSFVAEVAERFGKIDILVNNAGGGFAAPLLDVSDNGEATLIAENFTQVTHLVRRVVPHMPSTGSIVNITSIEAHQAAPGFAVYAGMKAAVESITRSLALELAPRGIRVNAVAPDALLSGGETEARTQFLNSPIGFEPAFVPPLGHFGTPDDGAAAVLFLSSALGQFVTGTTVHVDGGNRAAGGWRRTGTAAPGW
jgi:3-oxoacyl-[acyl-carrier protein] reductase